jgi:hypothetical protein
MSGLDDLQDMIDRVSRLPSLAREVAPEVAEAVEGVLERQIKAGTDPYGKAWPAKKKGDGKPLENAGRALFVGAVGTRVICTVKGPEGRHSKGIAKGGVRRQILPDQGIPPAMARAVKPVLVDKFGEIMRGDS